MTNAYNITWRGSPNFYVGRKSYDIVAICDHIMQSSIESADSWFKNAASEVSAHYGVARDGRIWQWVEEENAAWANGNLNHEDDSVWWIAECEQKGINPNYRTIAIEHEGLTGQPFTEEQYQATLWLHNDIIQRHAQTIQRNRQSIVGHYQCDSVTRPNCPGKAFPWDRLLGDLHNMGYNFQDPVTKIWVVDDFAKFYHDNNGLRLFGRPIEPMTADDPLHMGTTIQNFERSRFELNASVPADDQWRVLLGLVNQELRNIQNGKLPNT